MNGRFDDEDTLPRGAAAPHGEPDDATVVRPNPTAQPDDDATVVRPGRTLPHGDDDATIARPGLAKQDDDATVGRAQAPAPPLTSFEILDALEASPAAGVAGDPDPELTRKIKRELRVDGSSGGGSGSLPAVYGPRGVPAPQGGAPSVRSTSAIDRSALPSMMRRDRRRGLATLAGYAATVIVSLAGLWWLSGVARGLGLL